MTSSSSVKVGVFTVLERRDSDAAKHGRAFPCVGEEQGCANSAAFGTAVEEHMLGDLLVKNWVPGHWRVYGCRIRGEETTNIEKETH